MKGKSLVNHYLQTVDTLRYLEAIEFLAHEYKKLPIKIKKLKSVCLAAVTYFKNLKGPASIELGKSLSIFYTFIIKA